MIVTLIRCYTGVSFLVLSFLFTSYMRDVVLAPISLQLIRLLMVAMLCVMVYFTSRHAMAFHRLGIRHNVKLMRRKSFVEVTMEQTTIPFSLQLDSDCSSSYDEVVVRICSRDRYRLLAFWGVSIDGLRIAIFQPWDAISEQILSSTFLTGQYYQKNSESVHSGVGGEHVKLEIPNKEDPLPDMKSDPRIFYPLVVVLARLDECWCDNDVNMHVSVIHIKDPYFHQPSKILFQYIKLADGRLLELKQLYFVSPDHAEGTDELLCSVCQNRPLRCALLPCRHTCVCSQCLSKLKNCPMCRSRIESYFCIHEDEAIIPSEDNDSSPSSHQQCTASELLTLDSLNYRQ
uniref:Cell growth regulator with RING finger domain protein 1 n=1 Tax=Lygus hesperus TaxID=30085 RepID=A0A0A9VTZ6_LYGHE